MANLYEVMESGFNLNDVEASAPRDPLPEGDYTLVAEQTALMANRANTGWRLDVTFNVEDGPHTGRKIFMSYNVQHTNEQARSIALRDFKALVLATGVDPEMVGHDTDLICHKPFIGHVTLKQDTTKNIYGQREVKINPETGQPYPPRNAISAYKPMGGFTAPQAPVQSAPPVQAAARPVATQSQAAARPATPQAGNPFGRR